MNTILHLSTPTPTLFPRTPRLLEIKSNAMQLKVLLLADVLTIYCPFQSQNAGVSYEHIRWNRNVVPDTLRIKMTGNSE